MPGITKPDVSLVPYAWHYKNQDMNHEPNPTTSDWLGPRNEVENVGTTTLKEHLEGKGLKKQVQVSKMQPRHTPGFFRIWLFWCTLHCIAFFTLRVASTHVVQRGCAI